MDLINATGMQAGYTQGLQKDGRELLVVVVKGTFTIPTSGGEAILADEQLPLVMGDTFSGEPGLSAPVLEADFAPVKKRCDVVLNGSAYAPGGKQTKRVTVGVKVAEFQKAFDVVGDRVWDAGATGVGPSYAVPFLSKPISYDYAYGGVDNFHPDVSKHSAYMQNPVGRGFHDVLAHDLLRGTPLPNTEEQGQGISHPNGQYRPMSFGPIGRGWYPRLKFAGTYDQEWMDKTFPFLPQDFDDAYYQCAPPDQQMDYIKGGEKVVLVNVTPDGRRAFSLPSMRVPASFFMLRGERVDLECVADTLCFDTDSCVFTITWRASLPLRRNMFEVLQVLVGKKSPAWWRAKELGVSHYSSLSDAVVGLGGWESGSGELEDD